MGELLHPGRRVEAHIEGGPRCVVHIGVAADEEHDVFLVGTFQRLPHPHGRSGHASLLTPSGL